MDREFRRRGLATGSLSVLDRLAYIGSRAVGALTYHPPTGETRGALPEFDLTSVAEQARQILAGSTEDVLEALRIAGGSAAGARPKVLVGVRPDGHMISGADDLPDGYEHYLIKFPSEDDPVEVGSVEAAYALMAREAGVQLPPTRLFETSTGDRFFGVARFDRTGSDRRHLHTLGGLLHASHRIPSLDYEAFLRATLILTKDLRDVTEAFRLMAFNVFAHNRDDHVKNVAFLMDRQGQWRLAPAYDLTFSYGPGGEHSMAIAGEARQPSRANLRQVGRQAGLESDVMSDILTQVSDATQQWASFAQQMDVPARLIRQVEKAIREVRPEDT
jgi:serine/threonine-protein kinase HipA